LKKAILVIITCLLMFISTAAISQAEWSPGIRIDGKLRAFNPPCQIVNGHTMVPLRFVIEDEALQGSVGWDGNSGKVTISCRGKDFEFKIGSPTVLINGTSFSLDVPPYIYQDRTYLPLRFLAENLGGIVTWNDSLGQVNILFNKSAESKPAVFAYYYSGGFPELQENAHLFSDVALRWFETDAGGDLFYEYQDNYQQVLNFLDKNGIKSHASVVFMDKAGLYTLLSNPDHRANLINQLYNEVQVSNYDGVNIDFEFIAASDSVYFTTFLRELKSKLGADKELSVAVDARTSSDNWSTGYDYQNIGEIADRIVVMTYDYSYSTSAAGPVAPLWWVEDVVDYMLHSAQIPPSKLLLGMATYGYNWGSGQTGTTVTLEKLNRLKNTYQVNEYFDTASMSPYYTYTDANGLTHKIWLENERSLEAKWKVALNNNLGGISFWRIGNGFGDLYDLLEKYQAGN
jgi:spore germination protein